MSVTLSTNIYAFMLLQQSAGVKYKSMTHTLCTFVDEVMLALHNLQLQCINMSE
jgi:hypothetical protein